MGNDQKSSLEQLETGIYSRSGRLATKHKRKHLVGEEYHVPAGWEESIESPMKRRLGLPFFKKPTLSRAVLTSASLFFVIAAGISIYFFTSGSNIVSSDKIDIVVAGPVATDAGDVLELQLVITNNNPIPLEGVDLSVEYPLGTRSPDDIGRDMSRYREAIGGIGIGETLQKTLRAVLFGEEGSVHDIQVSLEYRTPGSNAIAIKKESYDISIGASPVRLFISAVKEINSGQEITFTADIESNSSNALKDVLLVAEYPGGFKFTSSRPTPSSGTNLWRIGELKPGDRRTVELRGIVEGKKEEERVFRFAVGLADKEDQKKIAAAFATNLHFVRIKQPFLGVDIAVNGAERSVSPVRAGEPVRVDITWSNNLPTHIVDIEITAEIKGAVADETSVVASRGFYRSIDNTVLWNKHTENKLISLEPGELGTVGFSFSSFPWQSGRLAGMRDPEIILDVSVKGRRTSEAGVPEEIISTASSMIELKSDLMLVPRLTYSVGPFTNTGPLPPKAEVETTFTVTWSAVNTTNNIKDARVVAVLPPYVRWVGPFTPAEEKISFNQVGGAVIWEIGDLPAGVGTELSPRQVSFQVAILPSISQVNTQPEVVREATIEGYDTFTDVTLRQVVRALITDINTDPGFKQGDDLVVP